MSEIEK